MKHKYPKIKKIYIDGKRERGWKFDRDTGLLEFKRKLPAGAKVEIHYKKQRKDGQADDGARAEQTLLSEQADRA
jgi:hypothetical protein